MALYLSCGLCGRKQAEGLLSRGFWGHLELSDGNSLCACPTCKEQGNWEARLRETLTGTAPVFGGTYSTQYGTISS